MTACIAEHLGILSGSVEALGKGLRKTLGCCWQTNSGREKARKDLKAEMGKSSTRAEKASGPEIVVVKNRRFKHIMVAKNESK